MSAGLLVLVLVAHMASGSQGSSPPPTSEHGHVAGGFEAELHERCRSRILTSAQREEEWSKRNTTACPLFPKPRDGFLKEKYTRMIDDLVARNLKPYLDAQGSLQPLQVDEIITSDAICQHCSVIQVRNGRVYTVLCPSMTPGKDEDFAWNDRLNNPFLTYDYSDCRDLDVRFFPAHRPLRLRFFLQLVENIINSSPELRANANFEFVSCHQDGHALYRASQHHARQPYGYTDTSALWLGTLRCTPMGTLASIDGNTMRHGQLAFWEARHLDVLCNGSVPAFDPAQWAHKQPVAVFRGKSGIQDASCHNYTQTGYFGGWTVNGTEILATSHLMTSPANWWELGARPRLAFEQEKHSHLFNINFNNAADMKKKLGKHFASMHLKEPEYITMEDQMKTFKYIINTGRNSCWADRLRSLLLAPMAVIRQHTPCEEYWEPLLQPNVHFLPTDSNFDNISAVVEWAIEHDKEVQAIVRNANEFADQILSAEGLYRYFSQLFVGFNKLTTQPPVIHKHAAEFVCRLGQCTWKTLTGEPHGRYPRWKK